MVSSLTPITLRLRKGTPACTAFVAAVNQGIDAHLEAVTDSAFQDCGSILQADLAPSDAHVICRRLYETQAPAASALAAMIHRRSFVDLVDPFTRGYIAAAFWTSQDDQGNALEDHRGPEDLAPCALATIQRDCVLFQERCRAELAELSLGVETEECVLRQAGCAFWLTRNGHGTGFCDRPGPEDVLERLSQAADTFGQMDLSLEADGLIYC